MTTNFDAEDASGVMLPLMSRSPREISMRSRFSCRGWTWITRKSDGRRIRVQFESLLEFLVMHMFATLPNFADLIEQPFEVPFVDAMGRPRRHRMDQLVTLDNGKMLAVTVKPAAKVTPEFREELAAVKRHLPSDLADDLILVTDRDFTRAQAQNALRFVEFTKKPDPEADNALASVIRSVRGIVKMGDLAAMTGLGGRGYRAAFRAAFCGQMRVLTEGVIGQDSLIKTGEAA